MKGKRWPVVVGASILSFAAGFLAKKNKDNLQVKDGRQQYVGQWSFVSGKHNNPHQIRIDDNFKMSIDGHKVKGSLKEISNHHLVWQDEFGYHLKVITNGVEPIKLYDEADDETYFLEKKQ